MDEPKKLKHMKFFQDFSASFMAYFEAFSFISAKNLWRYAIVPGLISLFLGAMMAYVAYQLSDEFGQYLIRWYPWEFGRKAVEIIAGISSSLLMFIVFLLVYKNLIVVLLSPFMSPLSVKVEEDLTGVVQENKISNISLIMRGLRLSVRNILKEILFTLPLILLSFIPVVGLIFTALIFIVQAYYAGFGNMDYALERYFKSYESIAFIRKNRGLAIGNGTGFLLLLMIPVAGLFLAPVLATVAGSMSAIKRLKG